MEVGPSAYRKTRLRQLAFATLLICELSLLVLNARPSAASQLTAQAQPVNPLDRPLPEGALKVVDASPDRFNAPVPLRFSLKGARFDRVADDVWLTVNGSRVTGKHLKMGAHQIGTDVQLVEGSNGISLKAYDTIGRPLYYNETLWCGNWTLRIDVVGADGSPVRAVSTIAVALVGAYNVREQQMTNRGTATFKNLPAQRVAIEVRVPGGGTVISEAFGSAGNVRVELRNSSTSVNGTPGAESAPDDKD